MSGNRICILITGGLGNLGSWVTNHFAANNIYDVTVFTKNDRPVNFSFPVKKIICDISDKKNVIESLSDSEFDYIIHLASINETFLEDYDSQSLSINAYGTRNLLEAISGKKIKRFIYMSTFHVYGKDGGDIRETDSPAPLNDYAITHLFAEEYIKMFSRQQGLPFTIFRLSNSYGCPKDENSSKWYLLFNDLCRQAVLQKSIQIKTNGTALRDFICMQDVCIIIEKLITKSVLENAVYNLGSGQSLSLFEVANKIKTAYLNFSGQEIDVQVNEADKKVYSSSLNFHIEKIQIALGFMPSINFEEEAKKIFQMLNKED